MRHRTCSWRAVVGFVGVGAQPIHQFAHIFGRRRWPCGQRQGETHHATQGGKVFSGVVLDALEHHGLHHHHRKGRKHEGVAIGRSVLDRLGRNTATRAGTVFNQHRNAECVFHFVGQNPSRDVHRAAGWKAQQDFDRLVLRQQWQRQSDEAGGGKAAQGGLELHGVGLQMSGPVTLTEIVHSHGRCVARCVARQMAREIARQMARRFGRNANPPMRRTMPAP